ncbi:MAG: glycosyltransferase 87 family protein [Actinomycetota bacterium]
MNLKESRTRYAVIAVGLALAMMVAGYFLKAPCTSASRVKAGWEWTHDCFSDITRLYPKRPAPFSSVPKYKPISDHGVPYLDNNFEYPALTGLFVTSVNAFVERNDARGYLAASAIGLGLVGLIAVVALLFCVSSSKRVLLFAIAPELVAYSFHNWDLLPVCATVLGIWAFARRKDALAGLALGIGTAAKFFPIIFLPVFAVARLRESSLKDLEKARGLLGGFVVGFLIPNAIVLEFVGAKRWWFPWSYQGSRAPNLETFWAWGYRIARGTTKLPGPHLSSFIQVFSLLSVVVVGVLLIRAELKRPVFRTATICLLVLLTYLISSKFLNPQYMLWVLPFFVLVRLPWPAYAFFIGADLFELGAVLAAHEGATHGLSFGIFGLAVAVRYVMMLTVLMLAWRRGSEALVLRPSATTNR